MKKERENQPLDDLFARKLGNLSMPPSVDGFDRLRARMAPAEFRSKVAFWRNPVVKSYIAAAACLVLICLIGWLFWPTGSNPENSSVTIQQPVSPRKVPNGQAEKASNEIAHQQQSANLSRQEVRSEQVTQNLKAIRSNQQSTHSVGLLRDNGNNKIQLTVAQAHPVGSESKLDKSVTVALTASPTPRPTESTARPTLPTERVLVVTIDEPTVLVATRQGKSTSDEIPVAVLEEKPARETTASSLWQKMKQLKQGELLAKSDNPTNDEQGLLSRAYTGLKHSIEKNKATKQ